MKSILLEMLVCPRCLPEEFLLRETLTEASETDIITGKLRCSRCGGDYPILEGIAFLDPNPSESARAKNRYETAPVVSSYLWSHFGDLMGDAEASGAYRDWAGLMKPHAGYSLDSGSAVGRFSFEMAQKCDFTVGIDNAVAFIRAARELMIRRGATVGLAEEGLLQRSERLVFPESWRTDNCEFIVGDAQALPFRAGLFASVSSLNIVDKVPKPLIHLQEINRVARSEAAQCLFSDPFSWSAEVAEPANWLGGTTEGVFAGRGHSNVIALLAGKLDGLRPAWQVEDQGRIGWKIRNHANHYESIRSCFVKAAR